MYKTFVIIHYLQSKPQVYLDGHIVKTFLNKEKNKIGLELNEKENPSSVPAFRNGGLRV